MTQKDYSKATGQEEVSKAKSSLENSGFRVEIVKNLAEAKERVLAIIPKGAEVFTATSVTLAKAGISKEIEESGLYKSVRSEFMPLYGQADRQIEMRRIGSGSDYTVGSVHAITQDGQVVIASATGSQLPNYVYGANHVIWVVGSQKIVKNLNEALDRIETYTFNLENERAKAAYGTPSSLNKLLIYRKETKQRVQIIIVEEPVGF